MNSQQFANMVRGLESFKLYEKEDDIVEVFWDYEHEPKGLYFRKWQANINHEGIPLRITVGDKTVVYDGGLIDSLLCIPGLIYADSIENGSSLNPLNYPLAIVRNGKEISLMFNPEQDETTRVLLDHVLKKAVEFIDQTSIKTKPATFTEVLTVFYNETEEATKYRLEMNRREAESSLRDYVEKIKQIELKEIQLKTIKTVKETKLKETKKFEDYLSKHKKIYKYHAEPNGVLVLRVQDLKMTHERTTMLLPPMVVRINIKTGDFNVNLDKKRTSQSEEWARINEGYYFHPHIKPDGYVCLGNFKEVYAKALAAAEFTQVVEITMEFLQTYNGDSAYQSFETFNFPTV